MPAAIRRSSSTWRTTPPSAAIWVRCASTEATRERLFGHLSAILDPEAVNREAFADQARLLESLGGRAAVLALPGFNHTPVGA